MSVGFRSLAVRFPSIIRTNEYYRKRYPEVVSALEKQVERFLFDDPNATGSNSPWDIEMAPYLRDPFRGAVERRRLGPDDAPLALAEQAATDALVAAGMLPEQVDIVISSSMIPAHLHIGDATFLAQRLGVRGAAFNIESTCNGTVVALQTACALVRAGECRNVLVVVNSTYASRATEESDPSFWPMGDGAGAFVVGPVESGNGLLGVKSIHTGETCGALTFVALNNPGEDPSIRVEVAPGAGKMMRDSVLRALPECCHGAAEAARVKLSDIDFFVFNTPMAWFHSFAARALDIDPAKTLTTFPLYGNISLALTTANLYHAARASSIREGSLVMLFGLGSSSSVGAAVLRWGEVALGPAPAPSAMGKRIAAAARGFSNQFRVAFGRAKGGGWRHAACGQILCLRPRPGDPGLQGSPPRPLVHGLLA